MNALTEVLKDSGCGPDLSRLLWRPWVEILSLKCKRHTDQADHDRDLDQRTYYSRKGDTGTDAEDSNRHSVSGLILGMNSR